MPLRLPLPNRTLTGADDVFPAFSSGSPTVSLFQILELFFPRSENIESKGDDPFCFVAFCSFSKLFLYIKTVREKKATMQKGKK